MGQGGREKLTNIIVQKTRISCFCFYITKYLDVISIVKRNILQEESREGSYIVVNWCFINKISSKSKQVMATRELGPVLWYLCYLALPPIAPKDTHSWFIILIKTGLPNILHIPWLMSTTNDYEIPTFECRDNMECVPRTVFTEHNPNKSSPLTP